jgi:DNA adenine methylase
LGKGEEVMANKLKTPLKYPGGKSRAMDSMFPYFPDLSTYSEYRETFLGGGSVAFAVTQRYPDLPMWVNDLYWNLYNFYVHLQKDGEALAEEIKRQKFENLEQDKKKQMFLDAKALLSTPSDHGNPFDKAAAFYIVNKCSFSGLGETGSFSYDEGTLTLSAIENLKGYSKLMKNWRITNQSYETLLGHKDNTFVYLDPPYEISSFVYGKKGDMHKSFDHDIFADHCNKSKMDMIISYNDDKSVTNRFPGWRQERFPLAYTMRSNSEKYNADQKERLELLLLNFEKTKASKGLDSFFA